MIWGFCLNLCSKLQSRSLSPKFESNYALIGVFGFEIVGMIHWYERSKFKFTRWTIIHDYDIESTTWSLNILMDGEMGTLDMWNAISGKYNNGLKVLDTLAKAREYADMHVYNYCKSTVYQWNMVRHGWGPVTGILWFERWRLNLIKWECWQRLYVRYTVLWLDEARWLASMVR